MAVYAGVKTPVSGLLGLRRDEGRGKLRSARGRRTRPLIPGCPNENLVFKHSIALAVEIEPSELKHLSTTRKRNQLRFPK